MLTVLQRVSRALVRVDGEVTGEIGQGALLLVCIEPKDGPAEVAASAKKIAGLRFFPGETPMDRSLSDIDGACLIVSQFTLAGSLRKGKRPSFTQSAEPEQARQLYEQFCDCLRATGLAVATGRFAAKMEIEMVADGPVTLLVKAQDGRVL